MQLSNAFTIARPVQEVYDAFLDIDRIATCMPGSTLLGQSGEDTYDGEVKVKVGPLSVAYTGQFMILERDPAAHTLIMRAKGREKRGAGNADAHIVATLTEEADVTTVHLATELNVRGKIAQFGGGAIGDVTDSIMQTFAANVEQMLVSGGVAASGPAAPASAAAAVQPSGQEAAAGAPVPARAAGAGSTATSTAGVDSDGLDAWGLIVKPMLQRHSTSIVTVVASIVTVAMSGLAAYVGARRGVRRAGHVGPPRRHYY